MFNDFVIEKVDLLKKEIDKSLAEDPFIKLKEKMKNNKNKLEFKTISQKQLMTHLKKLNNKKSFGLDGLSQENLLLGASNLLASLTSIIIPTFKLNHLSVEGPNSLPQVTLLNARELRE